MLLSSQYSNVKSTWLPAREKPKWWTKEGGDRLDNTKTCLLAVLTQCFVSCQWGSWSFYCCVHRHTDPSATWYVESRVRSAITWTTGSKDLLSHAFCWRGERKGAVLRGSPQPFPSLEGQGLWWGSLLHRHPCMFSTVLHPLGHRGAWQGLKEGDRQDWESLKIKVLKYTKCNTLEKV